MDLTDVSPLQNVCSKSSSEPCKTRCLRFKVKEPPNTAIFKILQVFAIECWALDMLSKSWLAFNPTCCAVEIIITVFQKYAAMPSHLNTMSEMSWTNTTLTLSSCHLIWRFKLHHFDDAFNICMINSPYLPSKKTAGGFPSHWKQPLNSFLLHT